MDKQAQISCCVACTLADVMKECETCPFRVGLDERMRIRAKLAEGEKEGQK